MAGNKDLKTTDYRKARKKSITFQIVAIVVMLVIALGFLASYYILSKKHYIDYYEKGSIAYEVALTQNNYYDEEIIEKDNAYVASLIDTVKTTVDYDMRANALQAEFVYEYVIEKEFKITTKDSKKVILNELETIKNQEAVLQTTPHRLKIVENIDIDYSAYNDLAKQFVSENGLQDVESGVAIRFDIKVASSMEEFANKNYNDYELTLTIPLMVDTVEMVKTETEQHTETMLLAVDRNENKGVFLIVALIVAGVFLLQLIGFIIYVAVTKNKGLTYEEVVNNMRAKGAIKLVKEYDKENKKGLYVGSFEDLLEIYKTIKKPILMQQNKEQTKAEFFVISEDLIYIFEEVSGDYVEPIDEVAVTVVQTPNIPTVTPSSLNIMPKESLDYSFEAKLALADYQVRDYYSRIIQMFAPYEKVKIVRSWKKERIYAGRKTLGYILFKGKKVCVTLALDVKKYEGSKYRFTDMSEYKKYEDTPFLLKLTSDRKIKHLGELINTLCLENNLVSDGKEYEIKKITPKSRNKLMQEGLIKEVK